MLKSEMQALGTALNASIAKAMTAMKVVVRKGAFDVSDFSFGTADEYSPAGGNYGRILLKKSATCSEQEKAFRKFNDDCFILATILKKRDEPIEHRLRMLKSFKLGVENFKQTTEFAKAMTTGGAGSGAEWIPTNMSSEIVEIMRLELKVASLFMEINMPTDPFKAPAISAKASAKLGVEATASTSTVVGTRQITLDAKKILTYIPYSYELEEDAAVALLPVIKDEMGKSLADALENACINGDDSGSHMDSDVTDSEDPRKAWKGLRKLTLSGSKQDLATFTLDNLVAAKLRMKKFGTQPGKLAMIVNYNGLGKLELLKDSDDNPVFLNRQLPNDPWVQGAVGIAMGMPVIPSEFIRDDLNASGVYDGSVDTKNILIIVRKDGFMFGNRGTLTVEQDRIVKSQTVDLVASNRKAFKDRLDAANNPIVAIGYNF